MDGWALWCAANVDTVATALHAVLVRHGFACPSPAPRDARRAQFFRHSGGTLLLLQGELPDPAIARAIAGRVGCESRYLELRLEDTSVSGTLTELPGGAMQDIDDLAREILHDWNEGEKYRSESYQNLVEAVLDLEFVDEPIKTVRFVPTASPRIAGLMRAVRGGARWEHMELGGQPAIRVTGPSGTQLSVLSPSEATELGAQLAAWEAPPVEVRHDLPQQAVDAIFTDADPRSLCGFTLGPRPALPAWIDTHHDGWDTSWGKRAIGAGGVTELFCELNLRNDRVWRVGVILYLDHDDAARDVFDTLTELVARRCGASGARGKWTSTWVLPGEPSAELEIQTARKVGVSDRIGIQISIAEG